MHCCMSHNQRLLRLVSLIRFGTSFFSDTLNQRRMHCTHLICITNCFWRQIFSDSGGICVLLVTDEIILQHSCVFGYYFFVTQIFSISGIQYRGSTLLKQRFMVFLIIFCNYVCLFVFVTSISFRHVSPVQTVRSYYTVRSRYVSKIIIDLFKIEDCSV